MAPPVVLPRRKSLEKQALRFPPQYPKDKSSAKSGIKKGLVGPLRELGVGVLRLPRHNARHLNG